MTSAPLYWLSRFARLHRGGEPTAERWIRLYCGREFHESEMRRIPEPAPNTDLCGDCAAAVASQGEDVAS